MFMKVKTVLYVVVADKMIVEGLDRYRLCVEGTFC